MGLRERRLGAMGPGAPGGGGKGRRGAEGGECAVKEGLATSFQALRPAPGLVSSGASLRGPAEQVLGS